VQNFVYGLLNPFLGGAGGSGRFRAAGLPRGSVVGAIRNDVGEFLLAGGEFFRFMYSIEDVCFIADCSRFLNGWKIV